MATGDARTQHAAIEEEAARAEIDRLNSARGVGLSVEIMKAWRHRSSGRALSQAEIAEWLLRDYPSCLPLMPLLRSSVRISCELLVDAGLLEGNAPVYSVSGTGEVGGQPGELTVTTTGASILGAGGLDRWAAAYARERLAEVHGADDRPRRFGVAPATPDGEDSELPYWEPPSEDVLHGRRPPDPPPPGWQRFLGDLRDNRGPDDGPD
jgi:hypothetical protein